MIRRLVAAALALLALAACSSGAPGWSGPAVSLRVLAGSELTDMAPVLDRAAEATGVRVEMRYTGSLAGADEVATGRANGTTDAVWFSTGRYLDLDPRTRPLVGSSTPIMGSPVVLGLRRSVAERLGWTTRQVSWADITAAAAQRAFTFGMTDPHESNSAVAALVGVTAAADGSGSAPDRASIERAAPALSAFFGAQAMTSGSTGYLTDAFVDRSTGRVPGPPVDGIVGYEASIQQLNRSNRLPEPLVAIDPVDGVVSADYPLTALTSITPERRDGLNRLTAWLRSPDGQRAIAGTTLRRPGNPAAGVAARPDQPPLVELGFPGSRDVLDSLIDAYANRFRRPARTVYVLDTSGSMAGERLAALQRSLVGLTGADPTGQGVRAREDLSLLTFSDTPHPPARFVVDPADPEAARAAIRAAAGGLTAGGNTAVYDSVAAAYRELDAQAAAPGGDDRITTVVLMTDGESNRGADVQGLRTALDARGPATRGVPVFPILFGEAAVGQMSEIAGLTGGTVFDARTTPLPEIFRRIRGYQ